MENILINSSLFDKGKKTFSGQLAKFIREIKLSSKRLQMPWQFRFLNKLCLVNSLDILHAGPERNS
jgi:hypothetical protein